MLPRELERNQFSGPAKETAATLAEFSLQEKMACHLQASNLAVNNKAYHLMV